jgi:outer membrane protein OmpA-like peptidoglycan-associated protein
MRHGFIDVVVLVVVAAGITLAADESGSKDHPLVSRYPGSVITGYRTAEFDEFTLPLGKLKPDSTFAKSQNLEGKVTAIHYRTPDGRSILEVYRNYEMALKAAGFQILFACAHNNECGGGDPTLWRAAGSVSWESDQQRYLSAKLSRPEGDVYLSLHVSSYGSVYVDAYIVEVKPMESGLVKVTAAALQGGLEQSGHVEVPGIYFDFNKSDVKPESKPSLDEIARMVKANPSMKVWVVGHTDSVGTVEANQKLSEARALAVVKTLVANYGIAAARLRGYGAGPLAPVASNKTEEGRAKNRRVELVEQ